MDINLEGEALNRPFSMLSAGHILLADDDEDFVLLFKTAFECAGLHPELSIFTDGTAVIQYFQGEGPYADRYLHPFPDLVVLDLRLPRVSGAEVLRRIRGRSELNGLPVVILTGTLTDRDQDCLLGQWGANECLLKPLEFTKLVSLAEHLCAAWLPVSHA